VAAPGHQTERDRQHHEAGDDHERDVHRSSR
jgi:hypothetical protein